MLLERLLTDIRFTIRMLGKNPGFALVAVLTLALGIGANATIFSVIDAMLLKPLPYPHPDRLVAVFTRDIHDPDDESIVSAPDFADWQRQSRSFEHLALFGSAGRGYDLSSKGQQAEQVAGLRVSAGFFPTLGVQPLLGRNFLPEEEWPGKDHVVVLSYGLWQRRYNGDPSLLGKTVKVDGEAFTVVGVMPASFHFQFWSAPRELWVPIGFTKSDAQRAAHSFLVFGRLVDSVSLATARAEMDGIGRRLSKQYPVEDFGSTVAVKALATVGMKDTRTTMLTLFAAVGFVLLIACVNVANLMLARGAGRQKELAMRAALGAGRMRIARQLLTESVILALCGGLAGLMLASWSTKLLLQVVPEALRSLPLRPMGTISVNREVLLFAFAVSCATGVLFGLMPALGAFRTDLNELLRARGSAGAGEKASRFRYLLIASEMALAMVVLAGAGLMIESMAQLLGVKPGFDPKNVLTLSVTSPQVDLYNGPPERPRFCQDLLDRVGRVPGVVNVSSMAHLPLDGGAGRGFVIEGRPDPGMQNQPGAGYSVACPGALQTLRIPLLEGRDFSLHDTVNAPGVVTINQTLAKKFWPRGDALGGRIKLGTFGSDSPWMTVVGIYGDIRRQGLDQKVRPEFMRPYAQAAWPSMTVLVRTVSAPALFAEPIQRAIAQIDPDRSASGAQTFEEVVRNSTGSRRFPMFILASLALLALVLAAVGIAGVVSYSVAQRTNEIGIRMALGARGLDVLQLVVSRSMRWTLAGVAAGLVASLAATRLLSNLLYNVRPTDPFVLGTVAAVLATVALIASYLPARRAAKVDPMVALRDD